MSNKRFTVNPFADLALAPEDRAKLVDIADTLFVSSGASTTYIERKNLNPNSKLPELLMVGPLPGTLDENMFGLASPTLESMRIKSSYLNDFSAAAVLATIVEPTVDDPFRSVVVKWMEIDIPGASVGIIRNRDYVYVESVGILHLKNGERVGYHLMHSVSFPQTHELPSRVRGSMSLSAIFRQEGTDRTDCRGKGIMDPRGDLTPNQEIKVEQHGQVEQHVQAVLRSGVWHMQGVQETELHCSRSEAVPAERGVLREVFDGGNPPGHGGSGSASVRTQGIGSSERIQDVDPCREQLVFGWRDRFVNLTTGLYRLTFEATIDSLNF
ncbi:unnamed protein product [Phytophthora lilii]|uniref:Unnamed protein product n=1 Tax=Phytophthora lilii TaxID=2077276 RepID=A0A9W6TIN6_9STRA|nr:unnamed protein product [Phytophthora lilii]